MPKLLSHRVTETRFKAPSAPLPARAARCLSVMVTLLACFTSAAESPRLRQEASVWDLTREADLVVVGEVTSVETSITVAIGQLLKGQTDAATIAFAAPPRPVPQAELFFRPPPPSWSFATGEQWVLFLAKTAGGYTFADGRKTYLAETILAVRQFLEVEALADQAAKVRLLVEIVSAPPGLSSSPALLALTTLNQPEHLDLLAPLAGQEPCRMAYISLLGENENPMAIDLLRALLLTENGDRLVRVIDALGRKDALNGEISKVLVPFLDHPDPAVRRASVFILHYRDCRDAFPRIVDALDDPDPGVRANALAWPWYSYVNDHPEVKTKIKKLRHDADPSVRDAAKRALAGMSTWYRLWYYHR